MAILISIVFSLLAGVTIMYENQYFWGKESNPNICTMNNTINNFNSSFDFVSIVIILLVSLGIIMYVCTLRGF